MESRRRSKLLRHGVVHAALVYNAYRPTRNRFLLVPSFFASWLVNEASPGFLGLWKIRTLLEWRRRHRGGGLSTGDVVGLGLTAGASVGLVDLARKGMRASEQYEAALSGLISDDELQERPRALRAGALLPLLNGNRRRRRTRDVVFNDRARDAAVATDKTVPRLKLDVYLPLDDPEPGEKRPAVLQIHGGAWVLGSKNEQGIPLLNHLASCGWVGFNVDYRLSPKSKFPDHLVDCKLALSWIREHAEEYSIDPNFVVVTGGSAGGHLCALMALTQNDATFQPGFEDADTSVQAAVPFYGVYDFTNREQLYDSSFEDMLAKVVMGSTPDADPAAWSAYSPLDQITADAPPMFVIHGDKDVLVPVEGARRFVTDLRATSNEPVVYAELLGAQHAFEIFPSFRTVATVEYVERFPHHINQGYLATATDPAAVEPTPDVDGVAEAATAESATDPAAIDDHDGVEAST